MTSIKLLDGGHFDFLNPSPEAIQINTIAVSLSRECRFGNQSKIVYSVAEHSVLVTRIAKAWSASEDAQRWALLHDAAEAYMGDMTRPLKNLVAGFKVIEKRVELAIAQRFGLTYPIPAIVKEADLEAEAIEGAKFMNGRPGEYGAWPRRGMIGDLDPVGLEAHKAAEEFLSWFCRLFGGRS